MSDILSWRRFFQSLQNKALEHTESSKYQFVIFGWFGFLSYPFYYIIWLYFSPNTYENLLLRVIASALCFPLILANHWPRNFKRFLPLYWLTVLLYCLPFFFTFMLCKNNFSTTWMLNTMSALVWGILLLDVPTLIVLFLMGIPLGYFLYYLTTPTPYLPAHFSEIIFIFASVIFFASIFSIRKEKYHREKLEGMTLVAASIAHELRTPLASISFGVENIKNAFGNLATTYQLAEKAQLPIDKPVKSNDFKIYDFIFNSIQNQSNAANTFINMLLMNLNPPTEHSKDEVFSIAECINQTLNRYPFKTEQRSIIQWDPTKLDFQVVGSNLLVTHILFNLIKNALYYLDKANKPKEQTHIQIWLEQGEKNRLFFKDTGTGIAPDILPHIFDRFFSKTTYGAGIGLTFCKMVMEAMGGSMNCESVMGEYTLFVLAFPKKDMHNK